MKPFSSVVLVWLLALVFAAMRAPHALAQPQNDSNRTTARQLGTEGIEAYRVNDFARADQKLEEAFRLYPTPTLGLWSGRARVQVGHWVEAAERFRDAMRVPETVGENAAQLQAQRDAAADLQALLLRIPSLKLGLDGAQPDAVIITVDGAPLAKEHVGVARPMNPGVHRVTAARNDERYAADVLLAESENKTHVFVFKASRPMPVEPVAATSSIALDKSRPEVEPTAVVTTGAAESKSNLLNHLAVGAIVVGSAGLVTAGVTALIANGKLDDCPRRECTTQDAKDSYDAVRTASIASFYVGGGVALAGLVTLLLAPSDGDETRDRAHFHVGPGSVHVSGQF